MNDEKEFTNITNEPDTLNSDTEDDSSFGEKKLRRAFSGESAPAEGG